MFNNIGHKIQTLAKVICWVGIVIWVIMGLTMMAGGATYQLNGSYVRASGAANVVVGIVTIAVGVLFSWVSSFLLYGFGQLVEDTHAVRKNTEAKKESTEA